MKITGKLLSYDGVFAVIETNEAEPLEPKPLWGVKPEVTRYPSGWCVRCEGHKKFYEIGAYDTETEAITAWNELVDRIQGER